MIILLLCPIDSCQTFIQQSQKPTENADNVAKMLKKIIVLIFQFKFLTKMFAKPMQVYFKWSWQPG